MLLRLCLLAWLAFGATGWSGGWRELKEEIEPGVWLLASDFGSWSGEPDRLKFCPTRTIELIPGRQFGWRFRVRTQKDTVKLRVALTLPAAPKEWTRFGEIVDQQVSKDGCMKISADRRTATVDDEFNAQTGWVMDSWVVAEGDPAGPHVVRIFINEKLVRIFRFHVVPPKPAAGK